MAIKPIGPDLLWTDPEKSDVLILGWGSTFGAIKAATLELREKALHVSACHVRYLNPCRNGSARSLGDSSTC